MDAQLISTIADFLIRFGGGLVATLVGFRLLGPKPNVSADMDLFHGKWGKHLKWLGPLLMAFALVQLGRSLWLS